MPKAEPLNEPTGGHHKLQAEIPFRRFVVHLHVALPSVGQSFSPPRLDWQGEVQLAAAESLQGWRVGQMRTVCCIAGGGPAGMMLGLLLARVGVDVVVLEKHGDFLRDFRGDTIHPSTLDVLDDIGLIDKFLALKHSEVSRLAPPVAPGSDVVIDLRELKLRYPFIAFIPQWDFLELLAEEGRGLDTYHLLMEAEVDSLIEEDGRVVGLRYRSAGKVEAVRALLTIGADGRTSAVRAAAGLQLQAASPPMDVLWFRISRNEDDRVEVFGKGGSGQFAIFLNRDDYWQIAYVIPKGSAADLEAAGIEAFRQRLADMAPEYADRVNKITSWDDIKLLTVRSDRLKRWWKPGLLLIGDAAHAMSPVGGVGINLAIQDAVATYNLIADSLLKGEAPDSALAAVQKRRQLPTYLTQKMQEVMQSVVMRRIKSGAPAREIPWFAAAALGMRPIRRLGARLIAVGFRPERIRPSQV